MDLELIKGKQYIYSFDKGVDFSLNIKRLTNLLSYKNVLLITDQDFDQLNPETFDPPKTFFINSISILGETSYLKHHLSESYTAIKKELFDFIESEADLLYKIKELQLARIAIKEFTVLSNIYQPAMMDEKGSFSADLTNNRDGVVHIMYSQCDFSPLVNQQWVDHQEVRRCYMELIDSHLALELDNLFLLPTKHVNSEGNKEKEKQLLEVWVALKLAGFLPEMPVKQYATHRKAFFELFNLQDRNFNDLNAGLKKRKNPRSPFLTKLAQLIDEYK